MSEIESLAVHGAAPAEPGPDETAFPAVLAATVDLAPGPDARQGPVQPAGQVGLPSVLLSAAVPAGVAPAAPQVLAAAESQVGVFEQPPGSNDGPQLSVYRSAVAGAAPGEPWCAYFASWSAAQAGTPLGDYGQGLGSVAEIADWAARTGRLLSAVTTPAPGDLILFGDRHVGIVESVNPDGSLTTVEGNYANAVNRVQRSPSEATGYVRL
jgi:hypothetical protein